MFGPVDAAVAERVQAPIVQRFAQGAMALQPGVDLIRIEGGKVVEVRLFSSDQAQEDAFRGQ